MHVNHYNRTTFGEVESGLSGSCGFTTQWSLSLFSICWLCWHCLSSTGSSGLRIGPESLVPDLEATIRQPPTSGMPAHSDASSQVSPSEHWLGQGAGHFPVLLCVIRIYDSRQVRFCPRLDIWGALQDLLWGVRKTKDFFSTIITSVWGFKKTTKTSPWLMHRGPFGVLASEGWDSSFSFPWGCFSPWAESPMGIRAWMWDLSLTLCT